MRLPEKEVQLPDNATGTDRHVAVQFSHHGDIRLRTRNGHGLEKTYGLSHGNEAALIASFIGYYARLGISTDETGKIFEDAAATLRSDTVSADYLKQGVRSVVWLADGASIPIYDLPHFDWQCLMPPMPSRPGTTELTVSSALYTTQRKTGELSLILASLPPHQTQADISEADISSTEFSKTDIPPLVGLLSEIAMGEYREDIATLLQYKFHGLPNDI